MYEIGIKTTVEETSAAVAGRQKIKNLRFLSRSSDMDGKKKFTTTSEREGNGIKLPIKTPHTFVRMTYQIRSGAEIKSSLALFRFCLAGLKILEQLAILPKQIAIPVNCRKPFTALKALFFSRNCVMW